MDPYGPPITTPGLDDTPYIRFAIDQLTRDEEIRGTRTYAAPTAGVGGSRHQRAESLQQAQQTQQRASQQRLSEESVLPVETGVHYQGSGYMEQQKAVSAGTGHAAPATIPARHPHHTVSSRPTSGPAVPLQPEPTGSPDVFLPFSAPWDSPAHPPLDFIPGILRPVWLGLFVFLMVLMLAGLLFCAIFSNTNNGLWAYENFGDNRYFVFQYLPTIFGMLFIVWLCEIQGAATRIAPFIGLSSNSTRARSNAVFLDLYPTQFLTPNIEYFRSGQPIIGACFFVFWLFLFTVPLLASSFNVQFFGPVRSGSWRWVAVQGVIWTTILLYLFTIIALILLAIHMFRSTTGLKWDPRSLADLFTLLERSNIMADYAGTETFLKSVEFRQRLWNRTDRLGYWHTTRRPQDIFYGIGEEGGITRVYSVEGGRIKEKVPCHPLAHTSHQGSLQHRDSAGAGVYSIRADIRSLSIRRRFLPWFLRDSALVAWSIIAVVLYIAFLAISFINDALDDGFSPSLRAGSNTAGFSAANFLYSFIPALLGILLFLFWQPIDLAYRRLEPWAQLSNHQGATAERSLLLDYSASFPLIVTIKSLVNRHWTVAYLSFISTVNTTLPILAGGMFWAQYYTSTQTVRIAAFPAALYALCFFLALYVASFFVLYPGRRKRALPHDCRSLSQVISWCYLSRLLSDRAFARCSTKAELVTRLVGAPTLLRESGFLASVSNLVSRNGSRLRLDEKPLSSSRPGNGPRHHVHLPAEVRYGFGVYVGRDGREHLGVDRVRRDGGTEMVLFDDGNAGRRRHSLMG